MKRLTQLAPVALLLAASVDPPPPPENLRVLVDYPVGSTLPLAVSRGSDNPLGVEHAGLAAWWARPDTNAWVAEWSTNGSDWTQAGQWSQLQDRAARASGQQFAGWSFAEAPAQSNWSARIRRVR